MIGVMGGTFDPVHFGHLRAALEVRESLDLNELRLVPAREPPHRAMPVASAELRLLMLRCAIRSQAGLLVDTREIERHGPSYTYDTLYSMREERPHENLGLILGTDAFCGLRGWYRWPELRKLAHFIVVHRPGCEIRMSEDFARQNGLPIANRIEDLWRNPAGCVIFQKVTQLDISSTAIREMIRQNKSPEFLLPEAVIEFITEQHLYRSWKPPCG
ncbi:MAG: nicotinate-nucleotide adenylyltransferase [Methylococcales bacterium]